MENASKALLMAGGVLIGLLIITLAVYLFTSFGTTSAEVNKKNQEQQLVQFNTQYTTYLGRTDLTIYDVVTVANKAKDHNASLELTTGERGYIRVGISGENSNIQELNNEDINKLLQKYADETRFNCSVAETTDGLISSVIFTKR